jgi:putative two-component system response regulator
MKHAYLTASIVIVDDQRSNVELLKGLLTHWGYQNVSSTTDSSRALELVEEVAADLLMLDLQMPAPNGYDILAALADQPQTPLPVPVLVLTADATMEARIRALAAGADDFLAKPFDVEEVRLRVGNLLHARRLQQEIESHSAALEQRVRDRTADLENSRLELMERLARAAEYRDDDTYQHARRVGRTAALLAERLELPRTAIEAIRRAAPLHDIGKVGISDGILLKPGRLTAEEFAAMKAHAEIGAQILAGSNDTVLQTAQEIALTHHERWDGTGYPRGLAGAEIPISGQLTGIADVFDALTHERPYKQAWPVEQAVAEIVGLSGRHFDPRLVEVFGSLDHRALLDEVATPDAVDGAQCEPAAYADASLVQAIFTGSPDAILIADQDRRYVEANPAACALLGMPREEILKHRIDDFVPVAARGELEQGWSGLSAGHVTAGDIPLQLPSGERLQVNMRALANLLPGRHLSILRRAPDG